MHLELFVFTLDIFKFFVSGNKPNIHNNIIDIQVSKMDLTNFLAQLVSILTVKLQKGHVTIKIPVSICRWCIDISLGKVLNMTLWSNDQHEVTSLFEKSISLLSRRLYNKLGKLLIWGRIFSTQKLKSSPTFCNFYNYHEPLLRLYQNNF